MRPITPLSKSRALRAAGFVRTPRLWVTPEQADAMYRIARESLPEVNRIAELEKDRAESGVDSPNVNDNDDLPDWQKYRKEDDDAMDF